jgi:hypothetical protein
MTQQDAALFFTPQKYRDLILPADQMIARSFDYTVMHFHSSSLHTLDDFLGMGELECIQIVVDPMGPSLEELIHVFKKTQEAKPLVIFADINDKEIDFLLGQLSSRGLCIYVKNFLEIQYGN